MVLCFSCWTWYKARWPTFTTFVYYCLGAPRRVRLHKSVCGLQWGIWKKDIFAVPPILDFVNSFSDISGYKINWAKSEVMPLIKYCYRSNFSSWKFQWVPKNLKYLRILPNPGLENISDHFSPALDKIHLLVKSWDKLQISIWGRVQTIKMVIAPKLSYLLNMIPLSVPMSIFRSIDKMLGQFIWAVNRARLKLTRQQAKRECGGLRLPNMRLY